MICIPSFVNPWTQIPTNQPLTIHPFSMGELRSQTTPPPLPTSSPFLGELTDCQLTYSAPKPRFKSFNFVSLPCSFKMPPHFLCGTCGTAVRTKQQSKECSDCQHHHWIHCRWVPMTEEAFEFDIWHLTLIGILVKHTHKKNLWKMIPVICCYFVV